MAHPPDMPMAHSPDMHQTMTTTQMEEGAMIMSPSGMVMGRGAEDWATRPGPMLMPIRTMIPGTWSQPGTWMLMGNVSAIVTNPGFGQARDSEFGKTHPYLLNDWVMVRGRTGNGYLEGMLMLNFEALTFSRAGWVEVGQAGEGLYDRQHQHQLIHQALVAVHPLGDSTGPFQLTLWGGQGSATIGPPIFMHRASNPSPTVPRKHHKGENPHETFPVLGVTVAYGGLTLDLSAFYAAELGRDDSRLYPRVGAPNSFAGRLRYTLAQNLEAQVSAERLVDQGDEGDAIQVSSSVYGRYVGRVVVDALLDGAVDIPTAGHGGEGKHPRAAAGLLEVAVRDRSLRDTGWMRAEVNQRIEPDGQRSSPWFFGSLGYERQVWVDASSIFGVGPFAEATLVVVPAALEDTYGARVGVTTTVGLQGHLMLMPGHQGGGMQGHAGH